MFLGKGIRCTFNINRLSSSPPARFLSVSSAVHSSSNNTRKGNNTKRAQMNQNLKVPLDRIRNIGIMAHIDAGKTTTTERMLFYTGWTRRIGDVHDGNTVMDYMDQERDRGITIQSAAITFDWDEHRFNLIDTPGHVDFTIEVERALRVLDGAVCILDGVAGVEAQTVTVWNQAGKYHIPTIVFVNKMDRDGSNMDYAVQGVREKLGAFPLVMHVPLGEWSDFYGVLDVVDVQKVTWKDKDGEETVCEPVVVGGEDEDSSVDENLYAKIVKARTDLIGHLAEIDDEVMDVFLELESDDDFMNVPAETLHAALRRVTLAGTGVPVLCGSAYKNKGVQPVMDAVVRYLPSPLDRPPVKAKRLSGSAAGSNAEEGDGDDEVIEIPIDSKDLCAFAFKVIDDKQKGPLVFLKMYGGQLSERQNILNVSRSGSEKVMKLMKVFADEYYDVDHLSAGNIGIATGLKNVFTGDTLVAAHGSQIKNAALEGLSVPNPVFFCTIEPSSVEEQPKLNAALESLRKEDPSFIVNLDAETGQTVLSGMGELHLEIIKDRILTEHKVDAYFSDLHVSYRECPAEEKSIKFNYEPIVGGKTFLVNVEMTIEPLPMEESKSSTDAANVLKFHNEVPHTAYEEICFGDIKQIRRMKDAIKDSVEFSVMRGPILGYPMSKLAVYLTSLSCPKGAPTGAIEATVGKALSQLFHTSQMSLLEPIMKVEVLTEDEYVGAILGDLTNNRRAQIGDILIRERMRVINATVPLSTLKGYSSTVRSLSAGNASCSLSFLDYGPLSASEQEAVVAAKRGFSF
eukprot:Nk52_evm16s675 gene=Nk52_evmTU16s675